MKHLARQRVTSKVVKAENAQAVVASMRKRGKERGFLIDLGDGRMSIYVPLQIDHIPSVQGKLKVGFKSRYGVVF